MDFKPSDKTIKDLLISGHQFMIPRFQRAYSWEKRHYAEFLRDIIGNLQVVDGKITTSPYFVGTMLFIGNFIEADRRPIEVVDGQQRLTTITILFSALSDLFKANGNETLAELVFKYIMTKDDNGDNIRVLQSKSNYPFFAYFIQDYDKDNLDIESTSEEESNIKATYEFFLSQLAEDKLRLMLKQRIGATFIDTIPYLDILKAIRDQVLSCSFISIATDTKEQANRIFEILNAKGKRLDNVDLIKNLLFEVANDVEPVDEAEDLWSKIRAKIEDPDVGVGMATFYRHFWASAYKKSTQNGLYGDFKSLIKPKTKDRYLQFLKEMLSHANLYSQIVSPTPQAFQNRQEYLWLVQSLKDLTNDLNIVQVRVPLMALLDAKKREVISSAMLKKTVQYLEGFHFAFSVLTAGRPNKIDSAFSSFAIDLHRSKDKQSSQRIIDTLIGKLDPLFPVFEKFRESFVKLSYTKKPVPSNVLTRYALRRLNCFFSNVELVPNDVTVEHIISESISDASSNIGNLILLESKLNHEAEDSDYEAKKDIYRKSKQEWVKDFVKQHASWTESDFATRANFLARTYYEKLLGKKTE